MKKLGLFIFALAIFSLTANAQDSVVNARLDSLSAQLRNYINKKESNIFKFGLSVGVRILARREKTSRAIPYVLPDSTIAIENGDVMAVILSSSLTAFPFDTIHPFWHNFGFTININLVEFANSDVGAVFNKDIDGGLGFAYAFGPDRNFAVGITYERISTRRPTEFILGQKGLKVIENGRAITNIDKADNRYYTDSGLNGIAFKFIYHFN